MEGSFAEPPFPVTESETPMSVELLVVHPEESSRQTIGRLAAEAGLRVCESNSAVEGVLLAREAHPTAVILNLEPPGMDGLAALALIRAQVGATARVLAFGSTDPGALKFARELGADIAMAHLDERPLQEFLQEARRRPRRTLGAAIASLP